MRTRTHGYITLFVLLLIFTISIFWYVSTPKILMAEKNSTKDNIEENIQQIHTGKYVLIHLNSMSIELRDSTTTIASMPIVSIGKPGSYYETIGGSYVNDYKEPVHFSSIGHVFMPFSTHVFGNFFIHGIPYYPDGTKVSSTYSGGCIRLNDDDAKQVYDFVTPDTPIIITQEGEYDFVPTATTTPILENMDMTRMMSAIISLEFLTQDNEILDSDGLLTTRRKLIQKLLQGDDRVSTLYANVLGEQTFVMYMNKKAKSLGLTNTIFESVTVPARTTEKDYNLFMRYVDTYKSYLRTDFRQ